METMYTILIRALKKKGYDGLYNPTMPWHQGNSRRCFCTLDQIMAPEDETCRAYDGGCRPGYLQHHAQGDRKCCFGAGKERGGDNCGCIGPKKPRRRRVK